MATEDTNLDSLEDLSGPEARRQLMRLIARQDIDEHREIYDALEHE
jgi:hypothetical protein